MFEKNGGPAGLKFYENALGLEVIARVGICDFGGGLVQLRLAEFDNRTAPHPVPGLSKVKRSRCMFEQLLGDVEPLCGGVQ